MPDGPRSPEDLSPREARDRFLDEYRLDSTDSTVRSYYNRLGQFVVWCEEKQIERVGDLSGWYLDEYRRSLSENAPITVRGKMMALKQLIGYLERIEAVDDNLEDKVPIPTLSDDEMRSDVKLAPEDAKTYLNHYRNSMSQYGTPEHTVLEIMWFTGCRMSGIRALDLDDYDQEKGILHFVNRPETDTRLKNGDDGERPVAIPKEVVDVLDAYIARERHGKHDTTGRRPLFSGRQGRPSTTTFRVWAYMATQPCVYKACPHGKTREKCKWTKRQFSSQCPSSRSPHQIRTGSITWQLNCGMPIEEVSERVNSSAAVIRQHYDVATGEEKLEERRRRYLSDLSIEDKNDEN